MKTIYESGSIRAMFRGAEALLGLRLREHYPHRQLHSFQERRLRSLLQHAYQHFPFYRGLLERLGANPGVDQPFDILTALPPVSKQDVRDLSRTAFREHQAKGREARLIPVHTTGATGIPLTLFLTQSEFLTGLGHIVFGFIKSGASLFDSFAQFIVPGYAREHFGFERLGVLRQHYIDLRKGAESALSEVNHLKPAVLYGFPSFLSLLARQILDGRSRAHHPKLIVTNGEILTDQARSLMKEAFACAIRDSYGAAEAFRIAYECEHRRLHIIPDSCVVEVDEGTIDAEGMADLLVTPLYLRTVPLIRYRIGDRAKLLEDPCPCGSKFPALVRIVGRSDDLLTLPSGRKVSPRAVNVMERMRGIMEYQIVQESRHHFAVKVKPGREYTEETRVEICRTVQEGCSPDRVEVSVQIVDDIPRSPNGKLRAVVSEVR